MQTAFSKERRLTLLRLTAISLLAAGCGTGNVKGNRLQQGLHELQGELEVDGKEVEPGAPIPDNKVIETSIDSRAIFIRERNAYLLREASRLIFRRNSDNTLRAELEEGALLSVFAPGAVTIRTPIAQIGIRGTGCYVESHPEKSYICLCYGSGVISSSITGEELMRIKTKHHDSPYNIYPAGELMAPMPVINHTDDELILLESLVGRVPPFVEDKKDVFSIY